MQSPSSFLYSLLHNDRSLINTTTTGSGLLYPKGRKTHLVLDHFRTHWLQQRRARFRWRRTGSRVGVPRVDLENKLFLLRSQLPRRTSGVVGPLTTPDLLQDREHLPVGPPYPSKPYPSLIPQVCRCSVPGRYPSLSRTHSTNSDPTTVQWYFGPTKIPVVNLVRRKPVPDIL